jgi:DNA-binding transcriptional LysR family regulator
MRLEWLEDIIAVIETGSFSAAAKRRFVTQPAFSRRIRAIEQHIGTELFDRDRKPVVLKPLAASHQDEFRRLITEMKELLFEFRRQGREAHDRIVIACQHAITATLAPQLVETLLRKTDISIRLRSANRDECLAMLMTMQVDLLISYQSAAEAAAEPEDFLERSDLGGEALIPVFASSRMAFLNESYARGELPIIAYPNDAFLGRLFNEVILPRMSEAAFIRRKVETALTLAALEFARKGIGVAWIPASLASESVEDGRLQDLSRSLPTTDLTIAALRLKGERSASEDLVWSELQYNAAGFAHGRGADDGM